MPQFTRESPPPHQLSPHCVPVYSSAQWTSLINRGVFTVRSEVSYSKGSLCQLKSVCLVNVAAGGVCRLREGDFIFPDWSFCHGGANSLGLLRGSVDRLNSSDFISWNTNRKAIWSFNITDFGTHWSPHGGGWQSCVFILTLKRAAEMSLSVPETSLTAKYQTFRGVENVSYLLYIAMCVKTNGPEKNIYSFLIHLFLNNAKPTSNRFLSRTTF